MAERVYVVLDLETTGLNPDRDAIIEVGAVRVEDGRITAHLVSLVNPSRSVPLRVQQITGIRNEDVADAPPLEEVVPELLAFVGGDVAAIVGQNPGFDLAFLRAAGISFHRPAIDTFELATILLPGLASYSLGELCAALDIPLAGAHRALDDAIATAQLFVQLCARLRGLPPATLHAIAAYGQDVNWPLLPLFEEAALAAPAGAEARTDLSGRYEAGFPSPAPAAPATLVQDGGGPLQAVPAAELLAYFAPAGPLQAEMGDTFEQRAGQIEMAELVLAAFNGGDHLLIEAGTGTGKSLAYLLPAALWGLANQRRVVIATNTIALQDQLWDKDIPQVARLLAAAGHPPLRAAVLKGRSNYLCLRRLYAWAGDHPLSPLELSLLAKVLVWLPMTRTGDVSELAVGSPAERAVWSRICSDGATCSPERCGRRPGLRDFYLEARADALHAHLLVVNHALLMADVAGGNRTLPPYSHLVVDEAHHLEEAATEQLTFRVDRQALDGLLGRLTLEQELLRDVLGEAHVELRQELHLYAGALSAAAQRAAAALRIFADKLRFFVSLHERERTESTYTRRIPLDNSVRTQPMWSEVEIDWESANEELAATAGHLEAVIELLQGAHWQGREPQAALLGELEASAELLATLIEHLNDIVLQAPSGSRQTVVTWMELDDGTQSGSRGGDVQLLSAPLYVGELVEQELIHRCRSVIFTGATLRTGSGFRFIRERLGLWDVNVATVASPFDYRRSTLLFLPSSLPAPNEPHYQQAVERAILEAAAAAGGRTLALFTSYAQLRNTADAVRAPLDRVGITLLQQGAGSRGRLLREFRHNERAVLLGTRSYWEGIDLPGEQLSVLVIVRLPFAVPGDPLVAARCAEFENPFDEYTLPDAILRFRQGFGRLIRRATDRGVVVLLDSRLWQKGYGQAFLESLPECTVRRAPLSNLGAEIDLWLNRSE